MLVGVIAVFGVYAMAEDARMMRSYVVHDTFHHNNQGDLMSSVVSSKGSVDSLMHRHLDTSTLPSKQQKERIHHHHPSSAPAGLYEDNDGSFFSWEQLGEQMNITASDSPNLFTETNLKTETSGAEFFGTRASLGTEDSSKYLNVACAHVSLGNCQHTRYKVSTTDVNTQVTTHWFQFKLEWWLHDNENFTAPSRTVIWRQSNASWITGSQNLNDHEITDYACVSTTMDGVHDMLPTKQTCMGIGGGANGNQQFHGLARSGSSKCLMDGNGGDAGRWNCVGAIDTYSSGGITGIPCYSTTSSKRNICRGWKLYVQRRQAS